MLWGLRGSVAYNPPAMINVFAAAVLVAVTAQQPASPPPEPYTLGPDSQVQAGVPKGRIEGPFLYRSKVFAGTIRHYWVYVPAQYDAASPAAVMVFQDGHKYVDLGRRISRARRVRQPDPQEGNAGDHRHLRQPRSFRRDVPREPVARQQPQRRVRHAQRPLRALRHRRAAARGRQEIQPHHRSRPARHRRRQLRRHLRVHRRVGAARRVPQGAEPHRQLHEHSRRPRVSRGDPQERPQAAPRVPAGRQQRSRQPARQLAAGQPGNGRGAQVQGLRPQVRVRRRRAHAQSRRRDSARLAALAVACRTFHRTRAAVHARPRFPGPGRCAARRGHQIHLDQHDLSRHDP